jgi:hypothetical protein
MIEIYAIVGGVLVLAGAIAGILTVIAVGIRREEKDYSFTVDSPSRIASGARSATGLYARKPGVAQQAIQVQHRQDLALAGPWPQG